jgi:hypothetical protein
MKNVVIVVLVVIAGVLGLFAYLQTVSLRQQRGRAQELTVKLDSALKISSLELQEKCARQSLEEFKYHWEGQEMSDYTNHYNPRFNKCFVLVQYGDTKMLPGTIYTYRMLEDAFEGKVYATYSWRTEKGKFFWDVPPTECKVTLPTSEEKTCHSPAEFDALVKQYME